MQGSPGPWGGQNKKKCSWNHCLSSSWPAILPGPDGGQQVLGDSWVSPLQVKSLSTYLHPPWDPSTLCTLHGTQSLVALPASMTSSLPCTCSHLSLQLQYPEKQAGQPSALPPSHPFQHKSITYTQSNVNKSIAKATSPAGNGANLLTAPNFAHMPQESRRLLKTCRSRQASFYLLVHASQLYLLSHRWKASGKVSLLEQNTIFWEDVEYNWLATSPARTDMVLSQRFINYCCFWFLREWAATILRRQLSLQWPGPRCCTAENYLEKRQYPRKKTPHCIWTISEGFTGLEGGVRTF